jgi:hypothetical protein
MELSSHLNLAEISFRGGIKANAIGVAKNAMPWLAFVF